MGYTGVSALPAGDRRTDKIHAGIRRLQPEQARKSFFNQCGEKIEHTKNGAIVEKVSIETGGPKDENGKATPLEIASSDDMVAEITDRIMVQQCLSLLSETDREILIRHANGETYAALANAYGYKTAGGMQKRIVRIKKQVANRMGINVE